MPGAFVTISLNLILQMPICFKVKNDLPALEVKLLSLIFILRIFHILRGAIKSLHFILPHIEHVLPESTA